MAKGYWIVEATIQNPDQYKKYIEADSPVFEKWGGTLLVRGGESTTLEGHSLQRHVVIEFDTYEKALECYHSDEYQAARQFRLGAADMNLVIVEGVS
jgi:uncharacterized protein (DUF1330 family)